MKLTECKLYLFYKLTTYDILSGKRFIKHLKLNCRNKI